MSAVLGHSAPLQACTTASGGMSSSSALAVAFDSGADIARLLRV